MTEDLAIIRTLHDRLANALGQTNVSVSPGDLDQHAHDQSSLPAARADVVVWPGATRDVSAVLRIANEARVPVVPWGAGTSLEGNPIPVQGGIVVDFRRMNRVVAVYPEDFQVTVQPGVPYKDLNQALGRQGLFFPPDPGANASIGGMIANNAAGIRTVRYGATRDNVLALEVVLANGEVVRTGSRSVKQSSGYDTTHLFVGSEGTLGLVTEATLRLAPIPDHFCAAVVAFPDVDSAVRAVYSVMACGLEPGAMELLDATGIRILNRDESMNLAEAPHVFMEFTDATPEGLKHRIAMAEELCADAGADRFESATDRLERERIWDARHRFFELLVRSHPGHDWFIADVAVPISNLPELIRRTHGILDEVGIDGQIIGHAGDGNLHVTIFYAPDDAVARDRAKHANTRLVDAALDLDGTATGEHGIGFGKQDHMVREHGQTGVALMRTLKHALDPNGILNPGKILP